VYAILAKCVIVRGWRVCHIYCMYVYITFVYIHHSHCSADFSNFSQTFVSFGASAPIREKDAALMKIWKVFFAVIECSIFVESCFREITPARYWMYRIQSLESWLLQISTGSAREALYAVNGDHRYKCAAYCVYRQRWAKEKRSSMCCIRWP